MDQLFGVVGEVLVDELGRVEDDVRGQAWVAAVQW
jgi:hypothetical protein